MKYASDSAFALTLPLFLKDDVVHQDFFFECDGGAFFGAQRF